MVTVSGRLSGHGSGRTVGTVAVMLVGASLVSPSAFPRAGADCCVGICDEALTNRQFQTLHRDVAGWAKESGPPMAKNLQPTLTVLVAACINITWWVGQQQLGQGMRRQPEVQILKVHAKKPVWVAHAKGLPRK